ncbi:MAG: DNA/RNA nuclease SfsA [Solobacterium sp.]|jgi:sugar fermentation stimulation protein A|uniref:DNA/RNA nuclease SfsA n=1 Tax=Inconstantimicrobium porci TaxID=2652291 RepID=UPI00240A225F|nr:DNA/RNA nuclease SfsA [Inconstantimicrobium porci]MDD6579907.1 DNA/RNA nuclease SfsA [Lachnospiraceae bacterium]MDD6770669.1 DNA/RNA nuclease SfsA [Inconstantimicrobium porci]MDD6885993.1 DNA/RNA nuclease SfsA [Solobacterium sp.]
MKYLKTLQAKFIDRPNRFIAHVDLNGIVETVHVKNTGRCKELLIKGVTVILEESDNESRKTKYDLIAVYKENFGLINIDSQAPNKVAKEWLESKDYTYIKPEYTYGNSRIDFYMEKDDRKYLMEVKGCTLERDGIGYFPDAPTERGVKHIYELIKAKEDGYEVSLAFVIQMEGVNEVLPNIETHPEFGVAIDDAKKAGVNIVFIKCRVYENRLEYIE